jgi:hypothetical protein
VLFLIGFCQKLFFEFFYIVSNRFHQPINWGITNLIVE